MDCSCFLCGVLIDRCVGQLKKPWTFPFRALYTVIGDWDSARLSRVGKWVEFDYIIPFDETINFNDVSEFTVDGNWVKVNVMKSPFGHEYPQQPEDTSGPLWGCLIHDRCWQLLGVADARFQHPHTVQALFDICRSLPEYDGLLDWGHNYGGMAKYDYDPEMLFPGEELGPPRLGRAEILACKSDPLDNPLVWILRSHSEKLPPTSENPDQGLKFCTSTGTDPFGLFPPELLLEIIVQLDSRSVANLRLASKAVVNFGLPEKFWSSRFWPGREFNYHFEVAFRQTLDFPWRHFYDEARRVHRGAMVKNRRRVWDLACQLGDYVTLRLEAPVCYGSPLGESGNRKWRTAEQPPGLFKSLGGRRPPRFLNETFVTISGHTSEARASLVTVNDKCYVSGFRIVQSDGESLELGYRHPGHEVAFTWDEYPEPGDLFAGFHVAFDTKGIRGLRMISAQGAPSSWIGDHEALTKRSIICRDQVQDVRGGFDALKMISISVYSPDQGKEENKASLGKAARRSWYPDLPDPTFQILEPEDEHLDPRHILPYSACMFGGKDGELLPYLTEIIVWIQPPRLPQVSTYCSEEVPRVCAVEFHYSSSRKVTYNLCCSAGFQSWIVGGTKSPLTAPMAKYAKSHSPSGFVVTGFTFQTSHGRSLHAPEEGVGRILPNMETFHPTQGTPVGFFAALSHDHGFQNIGLLCTPSWGSMTCKGSWDNRGYPDLGSG